jgi:hypothetical protein
VPSRTTIFERRWLSPAQMRTVANRRFDDASYLQRSNHNERANGVMYLAGFVIECLLKAKLLEKYPVLQSARSAERLAVSERFLWSLCYRSHDLEEILSHLPELHRIDSPDRRSLAESLRRICAMWTIHARYSPDSAKMADASDFLARVKELKKWLNP